MLSDCIGESTEGPSLSGLKEQETDQQIKSSKEFPFLPIKIKGEPEEEMKKRRGSRIIHEEETEKGVVRHNWMQHTHTDTSLYSFPLII